MQITEKETTRLITELNKKDELYHLCISEIGAGPLDGGCYATAKALQENIGGQLYTMWGATYGSDLHQGLHVLVKTGEFYWDGEDRHSEDELRELWTKQEHVSGIEFKPFKETDVPESPRDPRFVRLLSHFFKSVMQLDPEETAKQRSLAYQVDNVPESDVNPMDAIAHLLKSETWKALTPLQINNGNCDSFAQELMEFTGGELWETRLDGDLPTHFFVKWHDRYYDAQTPLGVQNWKHLPMFRPDVEIRQDHIDWHCGQNDCQLLAELNGSPVACLKYSEFEGIPKVTDIYVAREARRHGIASELAMHLQELYPDSAVEWDFFVTNAGCGFYDALPKKEVPINEVIAGRQQLAEVKDKLKDYSRQAQTLYSAGVPTQEQIDRHRQRTADWDDLHDLHDDLEHFAAEPTQKTIIEVPAILDYDQPDPESKPSMSC